MHHTRTILLGCALLFAGCAGSGSDADPAPRPTRASDPKTEAARLKEAEAAGQLPANALKHAAYLGDGPARAALGLPPEQRPEEAPGLIAGLGGPSAFRTALAGQAYADPEADRSRIELALTRWVAEPENASLRDATAKAVAEARQRLRAEVERKSGPVALAEGDQPPAVDGGQLSEAEALELLRLSDQIEALRFLEQCAAQADDPKRLQTALERALRPAMGQAYEDVERDNPGPQPSEAVQRDLAGALAAHNRGPRSEEARAFVKARHAHQRSLRPLAKERLLEALREALVPELLGR